MKNFDEFLQTSQGRIIKDNVDLTLELIRKISNENVKFRHDFVKYFIEKSLNSELEGLKKLKDNQ